MAELPVVKRLRKDMDILKRELTVELPKELERARAHGDLSENAEWAMAKQRQEFLRARLSNLEERVAELATINLDSIPRDTVGLGSKVELEDLDEGGQRRIRNRGARRSRRRANSDLAFVAAGTGADRQGRQDDIEVQTPRGKRSYLVKRLVTIHTILALESEENAQS